MANKTTTWFGTTDGDWTVAGNWGNGVPSSTAGDKDTVIYSKDAVNAMTTNLDRTGDAAGAGLDLALFYVEEGAPLPIGTSGSPLTLAADKIVHRGTGAFYFKSSDGTGSLTTDNVIVDSDRTDSDAFTCDMANGVTVSRFHAFKGMIRFKSSMAASSVGEAWFSYRTSPLTDVIVNVEAAGSDLFTAVSMNGGRVTCGRSIANADVYGGRLEQNAAVTRYVLSGGTVVHKDNTIITGMRINGGTMDLRQVPGELIITDRHMLGGATMLYNKDLVTITNDWTDYKGE